jgi:hypothetical protein
MAAGDVPVSALADKLREARALIQKGWTQHTCARNERGERVSPDSDEATCWCMAGAVLRTSDNCADEQLLMRALATVTGSREGYVADFNDKKGRTQAEVLAAFDKAIALAERVQA